jgi:hypothetical protein
VAKAPRTAPIRELRLEEPHRGQLDEQGTKRRPRRVWQCFDAAEPKPVLFGERNEAARRQMTCLRHFTTATDQTAEEKNRVPTTG